MRFLTRRVVFGSGGVRVTRRESLIVQQGFGQRASANPAEDARLVFRVASARGGTLCCEWVPLPTDPAVGDLVFDAAVGRWILFDGERWL